MTHLVSTLPQRPTLTLKKGEDRRLKAGHLWVYSNELDTASTQGVGAGDAVNLADAQGKLLGVGYYNPHSLIAVRLLSRNPKVVCNTAFLTRRLQQALSLRESCYAEPCYRWVYGEADGLPGLVIDRFFDYVVVQLNTAGMDTLREAVVDAVVATVQPKGVLLRCDSGARQPEGLPAYVDVAYGDWPTDTLPLSENQTRFVVPAQEGQKTGWFYDHRDNRARLNALVQDKRVLDVFSYVGGWGVQAARHGASEVFCVDSSERALDLVAQNVALNSVSGAVTTLQGNAFDVLESLLTDQQRFDVVVMDPPAFIKRKKDVKSGLQGYRRANELAMRLLQPGGVLVAASCSMHLPESSLMDVVRQAGRHLDRHVRVFYQGGQAMDHPVHPAIPETRYLKALFAKVDLSL